MPEELVKIGENGQIQCGKFYEEEFHEEIGCDHYEYYTRTICGVPFGILCDEYGRPNNRGITAVYEDGYPAFVGTILIGRIDADGEFKALRAKDLFNIQNRIAGIDVDGKQRIVIVLDGRKS